MKAIELGLKEIEITIEAAPINNTVRIKTKAYTSDEIPGLAIHGRVLNKEGEQGESEWVVTHISSGNGFGRDSYRSNMQQAFDLAKALSSSGVDFTRSYECLCSAENVKKILSVLGRY